MSYTVGFFSSHFDQATFLTLWAGSVFNTRPKCEDPLQGEGSTLLWCDTLSIMVGLVDIVVLLTIGISFVYIKATSSPDDEGGDVKGDVEMVGFENPMKQMGEMKEMEPERKEMAAKKKRNTLKKNQPKKFPNHLIVAGGGKEKVEAASNFIHGDAEKGKGKTKKWKSATNKLKSVSAFKQRRRSSLMTSSTEVDLVSSVNIHVDKATGRKYSVDAQTGVSEWLDDVVEEAVHVDPATGRRYNSKGWL